MESAKEKWLLIGSIQGSIFCIFSLKLPQVLVITKLGKYVTVNVLCLIPVVQFFSAIYEGKGMKFCTQVPRTCVHKRLVLDFHLFA